MQELIYQSDQEHLIDKIACNSNTLYIYQNKDYRWLTFSDHIIQGVMNLSSPELTVSPITQAFMLSFIFAKPKIKLLNLGLGTAAVERAVTYLGKLKVVKIDNVCTVEINKKVIDCCSKHFDFSGENVHIGCAKSFINETNEHFDIIMLDIIHTSYEDDFIQQCEFWSMIISKLTKLGQVIFNFNPYSEQGLLNLISLIRKHFESIYIIEFLNYKNIVIHASRRKIVNYKLEDLIETEVIKVAAPCFKSHIKQVLQVK